MISTRQFNTKNVVSNHPAQRKPTTISPNPIRSATPHFIQPGIACSPRIFLYLAHGARRAAYFVFTIVANDFASRLAPPTSAPSSSSWAINPFMLSALTLPP